MKKKKAKVSKPKKRPRTKKISSKTTSKVKKPHSHGFAFTIILAIFLSFIFIIWVIGDNTGIINITGNAISDSFEIDKNYIFFMLMVVSIYAIIVGFYLNYHHKALAAHKPKTLKKKTTKKRKVKRKLKKKRR